MKPISKYSKRTWDITRIKWWDLLVESIQSLMVIHTAKIWYGRNSPMNNAWNSEIRINVKFCFCFSGIKDKCQLRCWVYKLINGLTEGELQVQKLLKDLGHIWFVLFFMKNVNFSFPPWKSSLLTNVHEKWKCALVSYARFYISAILSTHPWKCKFDPLSRVMESV